MEALNSEASVNFYGEPMNQGTKEINERHHHFSNIIK